MNILRFFLVVSFAILLGLPLAAQTAGEEAAKLKARVKELEAENERLRQEIAKLQKKPLPARRIRVTNGQDAGEIAKQVDSTKEYLILFKIPDSVGLTLSFTYQEGKDEPRVDFTGHQTLLYPR